MSDFLSDSQHLDEIRGNIIDVETEQQKTNELLGQIIEELKKLNKVLIPFQFPSFPTAPASGYTCMMCGGWISTSAPHNCSLVR